MTFIESARYSLVIGIDARSMADQSILAPDAPMSGGVTISVGLPATIRIPIPGSNRLAIELAPRGWQPKGGSTSPIFIQDLSGKRVLRLDYGFNKSSGRFDWHWNQKGTFQEFGIADHASAGAAGKALGVFAKYFKYAGRTLLVVGIGIDVYSIVVASNPLRRSVQVVSAWTGAVQGCRLGGRGLGAVGTCIEPGLGTIIGGLGGCAIGGFIGYLTAEAASGYAYDWAEDTVFHRLSPSDQP